MEVHHHPQLEHKPKPWKEYLLEGLMIFLAVMMGFIAENIREGIADRSKGREYMRSFVQDLRADTAAFTVLIAFDDRKIAALDQLSACYDTLQNNGRSTGCLVPLLANSLSNRAFNFADGTLQQLKNAGGFRLLKKADRDSIVAFDHEVQNYQNFESTVFQQRQDIVREMLVKLIDFKAVEQIHSDSVVHLTIPLFSSNDKAPVNEFFNDLLLYSRVIRTQDNKLRRFKVRAAVLIDHFKDEYGSE